MKTGTLATKLMLAAIFLTVLVYFAVNLIAYFSDPYSTAVAYAYTGEKAVTVSGYVVRDEEVLAGGGVGHGGAKIGRASCRERVLPPV